MALGEEGIGAGSLRRRDDAPGSEGLWEKGHRSAKGWNLNRAREKAAGRGWWAGSSAAAVLGAMPW